MADFRPLVITSSGGPDGFPAELEDANRLALPGLIMAGNIDMGSTNQIKDLADGTLATDAVTLQQLNAATAGRDPKENVVAVETVTNIALTGLPSIDGVSPTAGQRVLLTAQSTVSENGIWEVAAGAWSRPTDFATGSSAEGAYVPVSAGTVYEGTIWVAVADAPADVVDTNDPQFVQQPSTLTAGDGIDITGSVVSVDLAATNPGLQFVTGDLAVLLKDATLGVDAAGIFVQGVPANFTVAGVATSANVTATNLNTLTAGTSSQADALHTHARVDAAKEVSEEVAVNEAILAGDPIEWSGTADRIQRCRADTNSRVDCLGIALTAQPTIGLTTTIVRSGIAEAVLVGATPGDRYWLAPTGGLTTTRPTASGTNIVFVGIAVNATDLDVRFQYIGRNA